MKLTNIIIPHQCYDTAQNVLNGNSMCVKLINTDVWAKQSVIANCIGCEWKWKVVNYTRTVVLVKHCWTKQAATYTYFWQTGMHTVIESPLRFRSNRCIQIGECAFVRKMNKSSISKFHKDNYYWWISNANAHLIGVSCMIICSKHVQNNMKEPGLGFVNTGEMFNDLFLFPFLLVFSFATINVRGSESRKIVLFACGWWWDDA